MKKSFFTLLVILCLYSSMNAASLYILYDDACMDKLEYVYQNNDNGGEYVVYQITTSPGVKVILEVGTESTTPQDFLPAQFIRCNNAVFDEKLVNTINSNIDRVFMVVRKGNNRYFISPITFAARYLRSQDFIMYDSPKYRFQFDLKLGTIGENIAYKNPKATVFFEGKLENVCTGEYIFRQYSEYAGNPHTDLILVPEVGIIEERSGINAADAIKNTLRLDKVNGKKLDRYLQRLCTGRELPTEAAQPDNLSALQVPDDIPQGFDQQATGQPFLGSKAIDIAAKTPVPTNTTNTSTHQVKKGETLYRISKMYGISVDQLRSWNGKGNSNLIYVGEKLKVSGTNDFTPKTGEVQPQGYNVLGGRLTDNVPPSVGGANWQGQGRHTVARGETVASIAMKYGYTEARFRDINNMSPNEYIKVGQVLKTTDCDCPKGEQPVDYSSGSYVDQYNTVVPSNPGLSARSPELVTVQDANRRPPSNNYRSGPADYSNVGESFSDESFKTSGERDYRNTPYFLNRSNAVPQNDQRSAINDYNTYPEYRDQVPATPQYGNRQGNNSNNQGDFYTVQPKGGSNTPSEFYTVQPRNPQLPQADNYRVPNTAMPGYRPTQTPQSFNSVSPRVGDRTVYIVKDGDSLYSIARAYGISIERLRSLNDLERGEVLIPYQKIYLN
jgi:LysM repeat protein